MSLSQPIQYLEPDPLELENYARNEAIMQNFADFEEQVS